MPLYLGIDAGGTKTDCAVSNGAELLGQATGAALTALCFSLAGVHGATNALWLGAAFAAVASVTSGLRLVVAK